MTTSPDADKYKFRFYPHDIKINPKWDVGVPNPSGPKPSYLRGDLALIKVPEMKKDKHFIPLKLPHSPYYPNGNLLRM